MFFVGTLETAGLGNRSYLAGGRHSALVVDPPRDIARVIAAAARRGVRIALVVETHLHNDYVPGGLELARVTGAQYLVPAAALVSVDRAPVADGDTAPIDEGLTLRAMATPGQTPHHTSYVLEEDGRAVAAATGASLMSFFRRGPGRVTPAEALRRTADGAAVLLDVRETSEWKAGHAPGAVHLPLSRLATGQSLPASAAGRSVVVICRSGHRSRQAARILAGRGTEAVDVTGGMTAWAAEGLPVLNRHGAAGTVA